MMYKYYILMMLIVTNMSCGFTEREIKPINKIDNIINVIETGDRDDKMRAISQITSLGKDGKPAFKVISNCLRDEDPFIRSAAIICIDKMDEERAVLNELIVLLDDKDDYYGPRFYAALAIGEIGPEAEEAIPKLIELLGRCDPSRWAAAKSLGKMGNIAEGAIPELEKMLKDEDEFVKKKAKEAINRINRK